MQDRSTDFEFLPIDVSLGRCQRYYQSHSTPDNYGRINTSTDIYRSWAFLMPVAMRTSATGSSSGGNASVTWTGVSSTFAWGEQSVGDSTSAKYITTIIFSAEL